MGDIYIVDEQFDDMRVDKYLSLLFEDMSRTYIQKLIKDGNILVNRRLKAADRRKRFCLLKPAVFDIPHIAIRSPHFRPALHLL